MSQDTDQSNPIFQILLLSLLLTWASAQQFLFISIPEWWKFTSQKNILFHARIFTSRGRWHICTDNVKIILCILAIPSNCISQKIRIYDKKNKTDSIAAFHLYVFKYISHYEETKQINPMSLGGTYTVHKRPVIFSTRLWRVKKEWFPKCPGGVASWTPAVSANHRQMNLLPSSIKMLRCPHSSLPTTFMCTVHRQAQFIHVLTNWCIPFLNSFVFHAKWLSFTLWNTLKLYPCLILDKQTVLSWHIHIITNLCCLILEKQIVLRWHIHIITKHLLMKWCIPVHQQKMRKNGIHQFVKTNYPPEWSSIGVRWATKLQLP